MMKTNTSQPDCQIRAVHFMTDGQLESIPLGRVVRLTVRKIIGPRNVRMIKKNTYDFLSRYARSRGKSAETPNPLVYASVMLLKAGDQVRVRSIDDIEATLDHWRQLKGCGFMPEMEQYCDTTQRVLKSVERFVDERDLRIRKTKGIVLLEGVICRGTSSFGRCDRNCYYFWREEWLEKLEEPIIDF